MIFVLAFMALAGYYLIGMIGYLNKRGQTWHYRKSIDSVVIVTGIAMNFAAIAKLIGIEKFTDCALLMQSLSCIGAVFLLASSWKVGDLIAEEVNGIVSEKNAAKRKKELAEKANRSFPPKV